MDNPCNILSLFITSPYDGPADVVSMTEDGIRWIGPVQNYGLEWVAFNIRGSGLG
jgi:hypothetical protein